MQFYATKNFGLAVCQYWSCLMYIYSMFFEHSQKATFFFYMFNFIIFIWAHISKPCQKTFLLTLSCLRRAKKRRQCLITFALCNTKFIGWTKINIKFIRMHSFSLLFTISHYQIKMIRLPRICKKKTRL